MGKIITLQNGLYRYELPPEPSDEKDIINHDKKKRDQKWSLQPLLDRKQVKTSEWVEFIRRERDRWLNGVHILINGELKYLTGMHYDHLQYQTFDFGKAKYYEHQTLDFYFRDLTRKAPNCKGRVWQKPRRYGMTAEEITEATYTSMETENAGVGLMSNESDKCRNTLMKPIIDSIFKRPKWMRPRIYAPNGKKPRKELEYSNFTIDERGDYNPLNDFLGGHIRAYPTTTAAMDGEKKKYIVMDEVWKWIVASPLETLGINIKCLRSADWLGKISMLSTMGDSDDYVKAVLEGIKIIDESNPTNLDDNGETISGLWKYFVEAVYSHDLPNFYDDYGILDYGRALEYIYNSRKKYTEGTKEYVFEIRRMPLTEAEGKMSSSTSNIFDKERLTFNINRLNSLPPGQQPFVTGLLHEDSGGKVEFESRPREKPRSGYPLWKVSKLPYYSERHNIDTRNRYKKVAGLYLPADNPEGVVGYDPVRYADVQTTSTNLSRASILLAYKYDYFGHGYANHFGAMLEYRPENPIDGHKEFFKACRFWGFPGLFERQVESVYESAVSENMLAFMLKAKDGKYGLWTDKNRKVIKDGIDKMQGRWVKPQNPGDIDWMALTPFVEVLREADQVDPLNTTPFNVFMSQVMLEYGLGLIHETNITDQNATGKIITGAMHGNYSRVNTFS